MKSPEINPRLYGQLIFDKGDKNIQWDKDTLFNKWCWENGQIRAKNEIRPPSSTTYKNKLKIIKDLNVRLKPIKYLEENMQQILDISLYNIFLIHLLIKENKWDSKLKSFCTAKEIINKMKRQPTEWENILSERYI